MSACRGDKKLPRNAKRSKFSRRLSLQTRSGAGRGAAARDKSQSGSQARGFSTPLYCAVSSVQSSAFVTDVRHELRRVGSVVWPVSRLAYLSLCPAVMSLSVPCQPPATLGHLFTMLTLLSTDHLPVVCRGIPLSKSKQRHYL